MLKETLQSVFKRDLAKLKEEIEAYRSENAIWIVENEIANSAGNLCLHLIGNLNSYIGAVIGKTGYVRQRDLEFSLKNIPRHELVQKIDDTIVMMDEVMSTFETKQFDEEYPLEVLGGTATTGHFLVHLATHLSYHLGQVNYHRRLLDK